MTEKIFCLRGCVSLFKRKERGDFYTILFLFKSSRRTVSFEVNLITLKCIGLFDGYHTISEIIKATGISKPELSILVKSLKAEKIIEEKTEEERFHGRYIRQINFFSSFEIKKKVKEKFQDRIEKAKVCIIGVGGIGSWVINSLVRSGVSRITVIDSDIVQLSNLARQCFFTEKDLGRYKVDVIKKKAKEINSNLKIETVKRMVFSPEDLYRDIRGIDLVINCSDYPDVTTTNENVSRACFKFSVPHILCGGYDSHLSFIGQTVIPYKTSCWECYVKSGIYEKMANGFEYVAVTKSSEEGGTLSCIASITANIHVLEAIKLLSGYAKPIMINHKAELDFNTLSMSMVRIPKRKDCSLCGNKINEGEES